LYQAAASIMVEREPIANVPKPDEVRATLDRMVMSDSFRSSPQLSAFLSFVVEAALAGQGDRIKGYTIGVEALKRNANFDPQLDPIVRVEATRLRRAMERYYTGPGADSLVRIELPRGTYVPSFSYRSTEPGQPSDDTVIAFSDLQPGNGMPTLTIEPFDMLAGSTTPVVSNTRLHDKLCDAFARFDTINIVSAAGDMAGRAAQSPAFQANQTAVYRLMGSVEFRDDGTASVRFRLLDNADGTVVWARVFERLTTAGGRVATEDAIVTELAAILVQPFGVIRAHERLRHLAGSPSDPRYRYIVEASESFRSFDPLQHARARAGLEHLTSIDPGFASGFSYLAALYFREYQYGYSGQLGDRAMLDRSLEMARKAIELKPENSRAYQILFGVLFARHEIAAAFAAGDKAMALNEYDTTVMSDYGGRLIMVGEIKRGMELLQRAGEFGTVRPSWHHFYMFLGSYLSGDLTNTIHHATQITNEDYQLGLVARVLAANVTGDRERARHSIQLLTAVSPAWASDLRGQLDKFFPHGDLADRLARDLVKAGLTATDESGQSPPAA
jgi:TolB-like protein